jgi:hypothetical protein
VTLLGDATWVNVTASVDVLITAPPAPGPSPAPTPPPAGQGWYLQNLDSALCLDTRGGATAPGSAVDQWTCVRANNEQYAYDNKSGHLVGG